MATANVNLETQLRAREQVINEISQISPKDRPFMALLKKIMATSKKVEWEKDSLPTRDKDNAGIGGETITVVAADWKIRVDEFNYVQMMRNKVGVDDEWEAIDKVGIGRGEEGEMNYQKKQKYDSLLNDNEAAMLSNNERVEPLSGATQQAGKMRGAQRWIVTNVISATADGGDGTISSNKIIHSLNHLCWSKGSKPDKILCGAQAKEDISAFGGKPYREISNAGKKLAESVDTYGGGTNQQMDIILTRDLSTTANKKTTSALLMIQSDKWAGAWLREPQWKKLGKTGDFEAGFYRDQLTLVCSVEEANGKIIDLNYVI